MSMRCYPIQGYGVKLGNIKLSEKKILKEFRKRCETKVKNIELEECDVYNFLEEDVYPFATEYGENGGAYLLIHASMPWNISPLKRILGEPTKENVDEYFWKKLRKYTSMSKKEFMSNLNYIDDVYWG